MGNLKQEAIKKAYGEYWDKVKSEITESYFVPYRLMENSVGITFEFKELHIVYGKPETYVRPVSIKGIENNNGWIRIENNDWLKVHRIDKMRSKYYINDINEKYLCISLLVTKDNTEFEQITLSDYLTAKDLLIKEGIFATHYQPIHIPKPPIY